MHVVSLCSSVHLAGTYCWTLSRVAAGHQWRRRAGSKRKVNHCWLAFTSFGTFDCHRGSRSDFNCLIYLSVGLDSSVGIATRYRLDGPGIESRWGRDFPHPSRTALRPTQPSIQWVPSLSREYNGRGVVYHPPHLAPRLKK